MNRYGRSVLGILILGLGATIVSSGCAAKPEANDKSASQAESVYEPAETLALWPDRPLPKDLRKWMVRRGGCTRITKVTAPLIEVYPAKGATVETPAAAILVCPGGGYSILAYDKEGTEICKWINSLGYTAVLLRYTVPGNRDAAFADAQRAMGLIRRNAKAWAIRADRIGMIGFSAGGHLTARLSTNYAKRTYKVVDAADAVSCRPDFSILIYPAYISPRNTVKIEAGLGVDAKTPRAFIAQSLGDHNYVNSARAYAAALKAAGVAYELHLYKDGGHGFGLRSPKSHDASQWPVQCAKWLTRVVGERSTGNAGEKL